MMIKDSIIIRQVFIGRPIISDIWSVDTKHPSQVIFYFREEVTY